MNEGRTIFGISKTTVEGVLSLLTTIGVALLASGSPLISGKVTLWITLTLAVLTAVTRFVQGDATIKGAEK